MRVSEEESSPALIWCPFPDRDSAMRVTNFLLDEGLVACVNIVPDMISCFTWDGVRDEAKETGALLKTNSAQLAKAIARLETLHPYEEPAILGWNCDAASEGTAAWLGALGK